MKHIIVPIDFSNESLNALNLALTYAGPLETPIDIVHVVQKNEHVFENENANKLKELLVRLDDIVKKYTSLLPGVSIKYFMPEGNPAREILRHAASREDACVFMTRYESEGWQELFSTRLSMKVIQSSSCPVITVYENSFPTPPEKIIMPIDSTLETREKVPYTANLAKIFNSKIEVVTTNSSHVVEIDNKQDKYSRQVTSYLNKKHIENNLTSLDGNNMANAIMGFAQETHADLLVVMTEQKKNVSTLFRGSYTEQLFLKSLRPILFYPTNKHGVLSDSFQTISDSY